MVNSNAPELFPVTIMLKDPFIPALKESGAPSMGQEINALDH
jgi:hypothetical protein